MVNSASRLLFFSFLCCLPQMTFAYWQQEVNYSIDVKLDDQKHLLQGIIQIEYSNNSPDTLHHIFIHLWPNAYKNEGTELGKQLLVLDKTNFHYATKEEKGYIDSLSFKINNEPVKWSYFEHHIDIAKVELAQALLPGQKISISTPFRVKIPLGIYSRLGHISQSYQITQWYPKPAVYDAQGWHPLAYLNQGEFYSEYGTFDVRITLPENYVVGATGDLQGESGEKEKEWLLYKAKQTLEKIDQGKAEKWTKVFNRTNDTTRTASSSRFKTLRYFQQNVHDFAWFANKDFNVLKGEVLLPQSQRKVDTWALFTDAEAFFWQKAPSYLHDATYYYSLWNGEYPYNHVTAVDGSLSAGSGMEYPNITVIGEAHDDVQLEQVIMHEVGHNWFYGILGSNERRYAWMDEGINSFNELRYMQEKYPNNTLTEMLVGALHKFLGSNDPAQFELYYLTYLHAVLKGEDQALNISSEEFSNSNYGAMVYSKSAAIFYYLFNYLGKEKFDYCMKMYFNKWQFKHPQPADLQNIFTENCNQDLSWFFKDLIESNKTLDYQIVQTENSKDSIAVTVVNTGQIAGPLNLTCFIGDSIVYRAWFNGFKRSQKLNIPFGTYTSIAIDGEHSMPESNRSNNIIRTKGLLRNTEAPRLSFLTSIENTKYNDIYYVPTVAYNEHDRWMLGLAIHNYQFPLKNTRFWLNPTYSFHNRLINGDAQISYFIRKPLPFLSGIEVGISGKQYSMGEYKGQSFRFQKLEPSIRFKFAKAYANSPYSTELVSRMVRINNEFVDVQNDWNNYFENKISCVKKTATNSFVISALWQTGSDFSKISATADFRYKVDKKGREFKLRLFAGKFLQETKVINQQFILRGQREEDYLYDNILLARNEYNSNRLLAQQIYTTDGGLKFGLYGNDIRGSQWMTTASVTYDLPIKFLSVFGDIGTSNNILDAGVASFYYDGGIQITLIKDVAEIYLPLFMSTELTASYEASAYTYNYFQKIRFLLNFNKLNLLDRFKNL